MAYARFMPGGRGRAVAAALLCAPGRWAERIREWESTGKDVLIYFNNDGNANAVRNARTLRALLAA